MNARPSSPIHARRIPFAAAALGLLAGCHGSAEVVVAVPADPVYFEAEPNDDAFTADDFGYLSPGQHVCIEGSVRDDSHDPQDGFAFTATVPIVVDFVLDAGCACADLDVWIYDPALDEFVGAFDSPYPSERGKFTVYGGGFHIVVVSAGGDASYRLDVRASASYAAVTATGGEGALAVGAGTREPARAAARRASPEGYTRGEQVSGPPAMIEVFVIDPEDGVVERAWIPARS